MELDEEPLPLEGNLPDFRPRERVDLRVMLEHDYPHVSDGQIERDVLVVLRGMHFHPVELAPSCRFQEVQVRLRGRLTSATKHGTIRFGETPRGPTCVSCGSP